MKIVIVTLLLVALALAQTRRNERLADLDRDSTLPTRELPEDEFLPPRRSTTRTRPVDTNKEQPNPSRRAPSRELPSRDQPIRETPPPPLRPRRQPQREVPRNVTSPVRDSLAGFDMYINGFHLDPLNHCHQFEAQHFCQELNDDITQCILLSKDGTRLQGVEYIASRELFNKLPEQERALWHSHRFEVGSGSAYMIPKSTDPETVSAAAQKYVDSYGKTFAMFSNEEDFPYGVPKLLMAFTRKGQLIPKLLKDRNKRLNVDEEELANITSNLQPRPLIKGADLWETGVTMGLNVEQAEVPKPNFSQCSVRESSEETSEESPESPTTEDTQEEEEVVSRAPNRRAPISRTQPPASRRSPSRHVNAAE